MVKAFRDVYTPFAEEGQLIALQALGIDVPTKFFRVISVEPIPTLLITIAASASEERQQNLEPKTDELVQWRYRVVTAAAQVVLRSPRGARSFGVAGGGQGFVSTDTETDWGTDVDRSPTEFFILGGTRDEVRFDNLAATEATNARFTGWKHYLTKEIDKWAMQDPEDTGRIITVPSLAALDPSLFSLLINFAGIVPQFLTRG